MNFLSHSIVLPQGSPDLARVGSALPDLWPMTPARPLPSQVLRALDANMDPRCAPLRLGIAHHLQTDSVFHSHPDFESRMDWLAGQLRTHWPELQHASTYAHVLVEMLLDRWLIEREPGLLDIYYQSFSPDNLSFAAEHAVSGPGESPALLAVLERFAGLQFLRGYIDAQGLAQRFFGLTRRLPWPWEWLPSLQQELVERIDSWHARLGPRSEALLESVRAAVAARLDGAVPTRARPV